MIVKCPTCEKESSMAAENAFRPFCCERCKLIDLGAWAAEDYKIPTASQTAEWEEKDKE
jgi:endogenous inhibitor of DNA gyrase (YacG/DUF329 family)